MKPPFDIAGDLDTPVSAFLKLAAFRPRFLLESVEGGERLGRYSFLGFGDGARVPARRRRACGAAAERLRACRPARRSCCAALRDALARGAAAAGAGAAPDLPLAGGLVGYRRLRPGALFRAAAAPRQPRTSPVPDLHYVAPQSLLVFDHLTRGIALLHAGSEAERQSLRREVIRALRGGAARAAGARRQLFAGRSASMSQAQFLDGVGRTQGIHRRGRRLPAGAVGALRGRHDLDPSRSTARCGCSIPRPTCTSASSATSRWSARRPRRW